MGTSPSASSQSSRPVEFRDYWAVLRTRWYWVLATSVIGMILGLAVAGLAPPSYTATTSVLLQPLTTDPLQQLDQRNAIDTSTERQIALSRDMAIQTLDSLTELPATLTPEVFLEDLNVVVAEDAQVLRFSYTSSNPQVAADHANTYAQTYVTSRTERGTQVILQARENMEGRLRDDQAELAEAQDNLDVLLEDKDADGEPDGSEEEIRTAEATIGVLGARQALKQASLDDLLAGAITGGTIISLAVPPTSTTGLSAPLTGVLGLLLGALTGVLVAVFLNSVDPRVRDGDTITSILGSPVGFLQDPHPWRRAPLEAGDMAGPLQRVAVNLDAAVGDARPCVVVLLDTGTGGNAAAIAPTIADTLASRQKTVLVHGEPTKSHYELMTTFERVRRQSQATSDAPLPKWVAKTGVGLADLVDLGAKTTSQPQPDAVAEMLQHYDLIVTVAHPLDVSGIGIDLAALPDSHLVPVVRLADIDRDEVLHLRRDTQLSAANVTGPIIIGPRRDWGHPEVANPQTRALAPPH